MPFIATCSFCRASKFRVPFKKRGTFATCPRCEHDFLLVPETGVDLPLMNYRELPFEEVEEDLDPDGSSELVETVPDHEPVSESVSAIVPASVEVVVSPPRHSGDLPLRLALVAFGLFGLGVLATQFPYGRLIAAPLTLIGLALAVMGWLGLERYAWLGSIGAGLNGLTLFLAVLFPSWLGLSGWGPDADPEAGPKPAMAVGRDGGASRPAEWVDAAQAVWEQGDVRVAVNGVSIGAADPMAKTADKKKERALRITVKISNVGVARAVELAGWHLPPDREAKLTAAGTAVAYRGAVAEKVPVFPGKFVESTLVFAVPEKMEDLRLELPAAAFGGTEPVRFQIPKAMIFGR